MVEWGVPFLTMKDFTRQAKVVEFKINDDVFRGRPHLPAQTMIDFTLTVEKIDDEKATPEDGFRAMLDSLKMVLMPESYKRFRERMNDPAGPSPEAPEVLLERVRSEVAAYDQEEPMSREYILDLLQPQGGVSEDASSARDFVPIELDQIPDILDYVMGEYGMRPTQSSADSSDGPSSPASGTNSTEPTSDVELTSASSPSTDS